MADVCTLMEQIDVATNPLEMVMQATKTLRGMVGRDPDTYQPQVLARQDSVLSNLTCLLDMFKSEGSSQHAERASEADLRICLQLIHNLCVRRSDFSAAVFVRLRPAIFELMTQDSYEAKTVNVTSAVCLQVIVNRCQIDECDLVTMVTKLLAVLQGQAALPDGQSCEFPLLTLQKVMHTRPESLGVIVEGLEVELRQVLFEVLAGEEAETLPSELLRFAASQLKARATLLFVTLKSREDVDPREVMTLLDIVCSCSHIDRHRDEVLKDDKSLLIDTLYLLRMVHESGRENSDGMFSVRPKLEDVRDEEGKMISDPVFGFKKDLVRLLSNLCYQNTANQNEVREHKGIELLLDCSQADGRNPLITQWVVLAVRNLCENNPENQEVIRSIEAKGKMPDAEKLMSDVGVQIKQL